MPSAAYIENSERDEHEHEQADGSAHADGTMARGTTSVEAL